MYVGTRIPTTSWGVTLPTTALLIARCEDVFVEGGPKITLS